MHWGHWFVSEGLLPHGFCYQWRPALILLHAISDALIALAYFSIPVALIHLVRRKRNIPFDWMFVCFGIFIAACGSTHLLEVLTLWVPAYWLAGVVKAVTAAASLSTAVLLVRFSPNILSIPSPEEMRAANEELERQTTALRQSEERFRLMAENIQEIFWLVDPQTLGVVYVSPAFEKICGRAVSSLYLDPVSYRTLIHSDDAGRVLDALAELGSTGHLDEEFRIVCPEIKWVHVNGFTAKDATGKVVALVGTVREITLRKTMEIELLESEDRYRDLVEHSHNLICIHDLQGRFLSMNERPARILGYSRDELLHTPMKNFIPPEAQPLFEQYLTKIQKDGVATGLLCVMTKSGERRIWEYRNTLRTKGVATPVVRGIAHDVTDQKRTEKALRTSEEKFAKAFRSSPNVMCISSLTEGRFIEVNGAFERHSGFTREEVIGHTAIELGLWVQCNWGGEVIDRGKLIERIRKEGRVENVEVQFRTKSGQVILTLLSVEAIELGGEQCLLTVGQDITAQKAAEEALRHSEANYRSLFLRAPCGIYRVAPDGRFMDVNDALVEMLGYESAGELLSKNLESDIYEHSTERCRLLETMKGQDTLKGVEVRWRRKDRSPLLVRASTRVVRNESEQVVCFETTVEDITLEEQFRQVQKMEALALLTGGIAHDFNNILAAVFGFGELVWRTLEQSDPRKAQVQSIIDAAYQGRSLTGALLALSNDEALPVYPLNVDAEIRQTRDTVGRLIGEHIDVRVQLGCGSQKVLGERGAFFRIILNLAVNARDAMPKGGRLTIKTQAADVRANDARYRGLPFGSYVVLSVTDTGCGMDKALQERIFEPFFTTKATKRGSGLGLNAVRSIVDQCSGHIRVWSEVGKGTTFTIYFPVVEKSHSILETVAEACQQDAEGGLIMIVEDDHRVREVLRCQLEDCGYQVLAEATPAAAISDCESLGPTLKLLITDVVMPDLNGPDLAQRLRERWPGLKVLFTTGNAPAEILPADALGEGSELLRKPWTVQELGSTIRHLLAS
jgi:two-component system, cell cycle sensor histidine kinase and response regulator CckA